jgi:hypothetical protein
LSISKCIAYIGPKEKRIIFFSFPNKKVEKGDNVVFEMRYMFFIDARFTIGLFLRFARDGLKGGDERNNIFSACVLAGIAISILQ